MPSGEDGNGTGSYGPFHWSDRVRAVFNDGACGTWPGGVPHAQGFVPGGEVLTEAFVVGLGKVMVKDIDWDKVG